MDTKGKTTEHHPADDTLPTDPYERPLGPLSKEQKDNILREVVRMYRLGAIRVSPNSPFQIDLPEQEPEDKKP